MERELLPTKFPGIGSEVYAGFWIRVAAKILDFVILLPLAGILLYANGLSKSAYFYTVVPNLLFGIFFEVYLVKVYGGTPGKLIMDIKVIQKNGDDVNWNAAIYRYAVDLCLAVLGIYLMILTLNSIDDSYYAGLGFTKKYTLISTINPTFSKIQSWINYLWTISSIIVLLANPRKRAIHDFIAGTAVVKSIYLDKIRESSDLNESPEI